MNDIPTEITCKIIKFFWYLSPYNHKYFNLLYLFALIIFHPFLQVLSTDPSSQSWLCATILLCHWSSRSRQPPRSATAYVQTSARSCPFERLRWRVSITGIEDPIFRVINHVPFCSLPAAIHLWSAGEEQAQVHGAERPGTRGCWSNRFE